MLDHEIKRKAIDSVKMYFNQKIRGYLINDEREKIPTENIEWSGLVNMDTAKLQNYFQNKVAENVKLDAKTFPVIIKNSTADALMLV